MTSKKTILIIEDKDADRNVLREAWGEEYNILEAVSGEDAMRMLEAHHAEIAAVVPDLDMLKTFSREMMHTLTGKREYSGLPVLVMAGDADTGIESICSRFGAWDFVIKPYRRSILSLRLRNVIARSRVHRLERTCDLAERDRLTGLYNREYFMQQARELILSHPETTYALVRMDIDRFRDFNAFFGSTAGDRLLKTIAADISRDTFEGQIYGRIESDVFCICTPYDPNTVGNFCEKANRYAQKFQQNFFLKFSFGIYIITNPGMEMERMYSFASEAAKKGKHETMETCTFYDAAMAEKAARERQIIDDFDAALKQRQLEVYLQPQCSLLLGTLSGAEALVRWNHPERGMIMPGDFIPVIEKNGMIMKLDRYMLESVCMLLHRWMESGVPIRPISLNLSRVSLNNPKVERILCEVTDQYRIPRKLIPIEITESAYMEEPELMMEMIEKLHTKGFDVQMDDFGSGYSSLNMLKAFDVDVLKIDMRFLPAKKDDVKSGKILASVLRMANWLGLPVVVEGVETREQTEFLAEAGCQNVQGYYFARPMPVSQYEQMQKDPQTMQMIKEKTKLPVQEGKTVSSHLSAGYTAHEMRIILSLLSEVFDLVRVVEPEETAVITFRKDDTVCSEPYVCFEFLGKKERCENCTSLCALQGQCVLTKYELVDRNIFYFASHPLKITMTDGSDKNLVLEIVSRITGGEIFDKNNSILNELIEQMRKNTASAAEEDR